MNNMIAATLVCLGFISGANAWAEGEVEKILGYQPGKNGVTFQVTSGGCTEQGDFIAEVKRESGSPIAELILIRVRPDNCHPLLPMGERFKFSYSELGLSRGESFTVKNPNGVVFGFVWPEFE